MNVSITEYRTFLGYKTVYDFMRRLIIQEILDLLVLFILATKWLTRVVYLGSKLKMYLLSHLDTDT